jgi:phosphoglycolate phosphatase
MINMIKLVIFDLDGTLLNTLDDLADCTNFVLQKNGFPTHEVEAYKYFAGNGVVKLLERALPKDVPEHTFSEIHKEFLQHYEIHKEDKTMPYAGMVETLEKLQEKGIMLAVATNKPHELLPDLMKRFFPTIKWAAVFGNRKGIPVKPNPQIVYDILNAVIRGRDAINRVSTTDEILYIGDTAVDMETAQNAGITKVGALWGFITKTELIQAKADYIIEEPLEIDNIVLSVF